MSRKPESVFVARVTKKLKTLSGIYVLKTQEVGRAGVPDLLICYKGRFIAWEAKVGKNTTTPIQDYVLESISSAGGISRVVTPETFEEAFAEIAAL